MNSYLLDTHVMIALLNNRPPIVRARFEAESLRGSSFYLSSVVEFELRYGIAKSQKRQKNLSQLEALLKYPFLSLPFDSAEAEAAGEIRADLERKGIPIGAYDVQIAGQALCHGLALVTANTSEFSRVPGLHIVDWSVAA